MKTLFLLSLFILLPLVATAQRRPAVPDREVVLEGTVNFRDMGGYVTTEYRRVKMERIYRGGDISRLTDVDMEELLRRKIYTVVDFRGTEEAEEAPDRLLPATDHILLPQGHDLSLNHVISEAQSGRDITKAVYTDVSFYKEKYRPFFQKLLSLPDSSAILFHCSTGKDYTGIAAALLLYTLDIPMETILSDYVVTNRYLRAENEKTVDRMVAEGIDHTLAIKITEARSTDIETMFRSLVHEYGSIDFFLYKELGINEAVKYILMRKFLQ